ncbi:transposable element Tcb2 transposase [Trichonephila clavipes]|nr:transposable element Tcb2 transposase [Trichonephila clavipes]
MKVHVGEICKRLEMQRDFALRIAGRGCLMSFSVEYETARRVVRQLGRSDSVVRKCWDQWIREMSFTRRPGSGCPRKTSRQEDRHIVRNARVHPTASSAAIQPQVAPSLGAPVSSRTIRRHFAEGHLGSIRPLRVQPLTPTHRRIRFDYDDNRVRVWSPHNERLNPAFSLQQHTTPTAGMMTAQWYVHDILQPHVFPLLQRLPRATFLQDNAQPYTARVSQDCLRTVTTLPWPDRSPDLSLIEQIWDHLGRRVGHPTSLKELEARLQEIWNEMSQDIIHRTLCLNARSYRIVHSR